MITRYTAVLKRLEARLENPAYDKTLTLQLIDIVNNSLQLERASAELNELQKISVNDNFFHSVEDQSMTEDFETLTLIIDECTLAQANLAQGHINKNICNFIKAHKDTEDFKGCDLAWLSKQIIPGACGGYSISWAYGMSLEHNILKKSSDITQVQDASWFHINKLILSIWDESTVLTTQELLDIKEFMNAVFSTQWSYFLLPIGQFDLETSTQDTHFKNRKYTCEFAMGFSGDLVSVTQLLKSILIADRKSIHFNVDFPYVDPTTKQLTIMKHYLTIFRCGNQFFLFDANNNSGEICREFSDIPAWLFEKSNTNINNPLTFGVKIYDFSTCHNKVVYPAVTTLLNEIHTASKSVVDALPKALIVNSLDSFKFYAAQIPNFINTESFENSIKHSINYNYPDILKFLLNLSNAHALNAMALAIHVKQAECIGVCMPLLPFSVNYGALEFAILRRDTDSVAVLLETLPQFEKFKTGMTPLLLAVNEDCSGIVKLLLKNLDSTHHLPVLDEAIELAMKKNHLYIVKMLKEKQSKIKFRHSIFTKPVVNEAKFPKKQYVSSKIVKPSSPKQDVRFKFPRQK